MGLRSLAVGIAIVLLACSGCAPLKSICDGDVSDHVFGKRYDYVTPHDPLMGIARRMTVLEDDIGRDGSITVKQPDVWGDANLMSHIQEHDELLAATVRKFDETIQAFIARSDQAALYAETALAQALDEDGTAPEARVSSGSSSTAAVTAPLKLEDTDLFKKLKEALAQVPPTPPKGIGLEPTELERQRSTFIHVNQALRRRAMGDDNSRAAGYGLYKFRVPVSVLPGRQTHRGYAAVATMRAQLDVDPAHLRYTFPKLAIADLVDELTPELLKPDEWAKTACQLLADRNRLGACAEAGPEPVTGVPPTPQSTAENAKPSEPLATKGQEDESAEVAAIGPGGIAQGIGVRGVVNVYGKQSVNSLRRIAVDRLGVTVPKAAELRQFLFEHFGQIQNVLKARGALEMLIEDPSTGRPDNFIIAVAEAISRGEMMTCKGGWRDTWIRGFMETGVGGLGTANDCELAQSAWMLAVHYGILDKNLKKIVEELYHENKLAADAVEISRLVQFFNPDQMPEETFRLWKTIICEEFPLYVFTLDPQVEEQNVYDAFSRQRELQLALAYSVASGRFNVAQRVNLARKLAMDMATIGINRTQVAFAHGNDTFGWYFYPRVQTPPEESSNIGAFARLIWSTGPTRRYDLVHREIEPGMRECEVLIAMPAFVTGLTFDVTTNWEKLNRPGVTKRSYEEMIARGSYLEQIRRQLMSMCDHPRYRAGDCQRLISRLDQLEQMFSMQTYQVHVPYEYEQSGKDLFDTGDVHLRPVLYGYYGLQFVADTHSPPACTPTEANAQDAHFFLTGKNFHPTLTHVIVGGCATNAVVVSKAPESGKTEIPRPDPPEVKVISRELLRVKVPRLNSNLSKDRRFVVRVGTPAGVSDALEIPAKPSQDNPPCPKETLEEKPPVVDGVEDNRKEESPEEAEDTAPGAGNRGVSATGPDEGNWRSGGKIAAPQAASSQAPLLRMPTE